MARVTVRLTPRAGRDAIDGWTDDGVLRVRVAAAPTDGEANAALVRLLAKALGIAPSSVTIVSGTSGRTKVVEIAGRSVDAVRSALTAE